MGRARLRPFGKITAIRGNFRNQAMFGQYVGNPTRLGRKAMIFFYPRYDFFIRRHST